jgi:hypothetical protein
VTDPRITFEGTVAEPKPASFAPPADDAKTKVMSVLQVQLSKPDADGKVRVDASGEVNTGGWTSPALVPTKNAPKDGRTHLDLVAKKPVGIATQAIQPIAASTTVPAGAGKLTVVVHAARGSVEQTIVLPSGQLK